MSKVWYGSLQNRLEENKQFCEEIKVGTGMTRYSWSDTDAYEVVEVIDQKHVKVREYDHKLVGEAYSNDWELISNTENPLTELVKRGKYWYVAITLTPEQAKEIKESHDVEGLVWACNCGFILDEIIESGKSKTKYHRWNVSFGVAQYYYDYCF